MPDMNTAASEQSQSDKFKTLAREVDADPDEKAWDERPKKVAAQRLPPEKPE